MNPETQQKNLDTLYSDKQVIEAIRNEVSGNQLVLKWFFHSVRQYSIMYLSKKYPGIEPMEWDTIFSTTNFRVVKRLKNGLCLQEGTSLSTYYTGVANFAVLDYFNERKVRANSLTTNLSYIELPKIENKIDNHEKSIKIRQWLSAIIGNEEQLKVLLLHAKGFSFKEIVEKTSYESEGACRNAAMKGKNKISQYLLNKPNEKILIKKWLEK